MKDIVDFILTGDGFDDNWGLQPQESMFSAPHTLSGHKRNADEIKIPEQETPVFTSCTQHPIIRRKILVGKTLPKNQVNEQTRPLFENTLETQFVELMKNYRVTLLKTYNELNKSNTSLSNATRNISTLMIEYDNAHPSSHGRFLKPKTFRYLQDENTKLLNLFVFSQNGLIDKSISEGVAFALGVPFSQLKEAYEHAAQEIKIIEKIQSAEKFAYKNEDLSDLSKITERLKKDSEALGPKPLEAAQSQFVIDTSLFDTSSLNKRNANKI
jgi:hypothetical protein